MVCRGLCARPEFKFVRALKEKLYECGASRCNGDCHEWIKYDGMYCPCCGTRLRKNPRSKTGITIKAKIKKSRIS